MYFHIALRFPPDCLLDSPEPMGDADLASVCSEAAHIAESSPLRLHGRVISSAVSFLVEKCEYCIAGIWPFGQIFFHFHLSLSVK